MSAYYICEIDRNEQKEAKDATRAAILKAGLEPYRRFKAKQNAEAYANNVKAATGARLIVSEAYFAMSPF